MSFHQVFLIIHLSQFLQLHFLLMKSGQMSFFGFDRVVVFKAKLAGQLVIGINIFAIFRLEVKRIDKEVGSNAS